LKILVTGGAGFIGSHLTERLVDQGHEVTVIDDLSAGKLINLRSVQDKIKFCEGSICNCELLNSLAQGTDAIFHLATQCLVKGLGDPRLMHNVNDIGTFNVCLVAKEYNSKIVFIGTSEEYGPQKSYPIKESANLNPVSIYGSTKAVAEHYVKFFNKIYHVPAVIIRPFNTFGPRQREDAYAGVITTFIKKVKSGLPLTILGDGRQTRDFTYISDIVDGILLLSRLRDGEIVNLGSGNEVSILKVAYTVYRAWTGKQKAPIEYDKPRINDLKRLRADISLARTYGYLPKVSFEEGIKNYVEWYKTKEDIVNRL
jgi:UDP-glucose 4-epimerase